MRVWVRCRGLGPTFGAMALTCIELLMAGCAIDSREVDVLAESNEPASARGAPAGQAPGSDEPAESSTTSITSMTGTPSMTATPSMTSTNVEPPSPPADDVGSEVGVTLVASTALLAFGNQEVGIASSALDWTITNPTEFPSGELTLSNPQPQEFQTTSNCARVLGAHASCTIGVVLLPAASGPRSGTLELTDGTSRVALQVTGNGLFRLTVVQAGLGLGSVTSSGTDLDCGSSCSALVSGPLTLNARTQNGDNSFFTGWSNSACDGQNRDCTLLVDRSQSVTANFAPMDYNLIFVSSKAYPPTLGGLGAYDAECNALANAAGINDR
jgi:hypothetical protein